MIGQEGCKKHTKMATNTLYKHILFLDLSTVVSLIFIGINFSWIHFVIYAFRGLICLLDGA